MKLSTRYLRAKCAKTTEQIFEISIIWTVFGTAEIEFLSWLLIAGSSHLVSWCLLMAS